MKVKKLVKFKKNVTFHKPKQGYRVQIWTTVKICKSCLQNAITINFWSRQVFTCYIILLNVYFLYSFYEYKVSHLNFL